MSLPKDQAWFGAKRYGYGWGLPLRWQGWGVLLGYVAALVAAAFFVEPAGQDWFSGCVVALTVLLVAICAWKGEPARWRWGGK